MEAFAHELSLLIADFVGILALPFGAQAIPSLSLLSHDPLPNRVFACPDYVHDFIHGSATAIQAGRLQTLDFVPIACSTLCFSKLRDFFLAEMNLSFCHLSILHHLLSFPEVHHIYKYHCPFFGGDGTHNRLYWN